MTKVKHTLISERIFILCTLVGHAHGIPNSTMCVLGTELKSSGLVASTSTC